MYGPGGGGFDFISDQQKLSRLSQADLESKVCRRLRALRTARVSLINVEFTESELQGMLTLLYTSRQVSP